MKIIAKNKIARYNYELSEHFEAGVVLEGWEVKSIRAGKVNLKNAFASFKNGELFLSNMHVSLYMSVKGDETRPRKLLLHKKQIKRLELKQKQTGFTLIPTIIYFNKKSLIKLEIAIAKGKNKADKRESEKQKTDERKIAQTISQMGV